MNKKLAQECEEILQILITRHKFLQPANKDYGIFDKEDAMEVVADLIEFINQSEEIEQAHQKTDWGK